MNISVKLIIWNKRKVFSKLHGLGCREVTEDVLDNADDREDDLNLYELHGQVIDNISFPFNATAFKAY